MKQQPMSTYAFLKAIPTPDAARTYIEDRRWPKGPTCPACAEKERIGVRDNGFYRCNACLLDFTVRTGTVFERSHVPLDKWLHAMFLLMTARKGISSVQLGKEIGVSQQTAWFLLHRIREGCGREMSALQGTVEIDETFIGGKEKNKRKSDRVYGKGATEGKSAVLGMRERNGRAKAVLIPSVDARVLRDAIVANVQPGATIHTDEHAGYYRLPQQGYGHEAVNHSKDEYVRGDVTTNGVESVWAVLKRGLHGVYHHASRKHLARYVNEFTFRLNEGNVRRPRMDRLADLVCACFGKRLTYERLIAE